ncbi:MAG: flippase-like domain-containing protein [Methanobacterium sp.]|nr:flippase-like domain-containing protein [Methanobacterium sp.]
MKRFYVFAISIALIIILILWIGPENIINTFKTVNLKWFFVALLIHFLAIGVRSFRWGFIINKPFEFKNNYIVKVIGLFAGNFSPMRTAGEVMGAVAAKKINKINLSEGLSAGLTERFFDLVIVGFLLIISSIWVENTRFMSMLGGSVTLFIVVLIYLINWREDTSIWIYEKIHPFLCKLPINDNVLDNMYFKFRDGLKRMTGYTNSFTTSKNLIFVCIMSIMAWLLECSRLYIVFYAFGVDINFVAVIIIFLIANIIGVISALPGGIGSIEVAITGILVFFGVSGALAGSIAIADRLVSFWATTVLGIIFSSYYAGDMLGEVKKYTLDLKMSKE